MMLPIQNSESPVIMHYRLMLQGDALF